MILWRVQLLVCIATFIFNQSQQFTSSLAPKVASIFLWNTSITSVTARSYLEVRHLNNRSKYVYGMLGLPHFKSSLGDRHSAKMQQSSLRLVKVPVTACSTQYVLEC